MNIQLVANSLLVVMTSEQPQQQPVHRCTPNVL